MKKKLVKLLSITSLISSVFLSLTISISTKPIEAKAYFKPTKTYTNHDADTYYNDVSDSLSGDSLLNKLRAINKDRRKTTTGYSSGGTSATSSTFIYTDYDTSDPSTLEVDSNGQTYGTVISSFYSYKPCTSFNKEHVWPKTHGGNLVESDIHMARPTITEENSNRGHSYYVEGMADSQKGWDPYYAFHLHYTDKTGDLGEQTINSRGEAARITMYCMVANDQLKLEAGHNNSSKTNNKMMGDLETILKWNLDIPVTEREQNRNEGAEYLQGNRNPFIDHPEYACKIWGDTNSATKSICKAAPIAKSLTNLEYSGNLAKKNYTDGETFNPAGLTIKAVFSDGSKADVSNEIVWSPNKLSVGTTSIIGSYTYEGITKTVTITGITVSPVTIHVTGVTLDKEILDLNIGNSFVLTANVLPSNASNKEVVWKSTDESVATVDKGVVNAIGSGSADIVVETIDGNFIATAEVVVRPNADIKVEEISCIKELTLNVGESYELEYEIFPTNVTDNNVTFYSSDDSIATIDDNGKITSKEVGEAIITIASNDGGAITTCHLEVKPAKGKDDDDDNKDKTFGCKGNILGSSILVLFSSLIGFILLVLFKRKNHKLDK